MDITELLELLHKKYPDDWDKDMYPALVLYDDGSGYITKNDMKLASGENRLFMFNSIKKLISHLQS
jgi:hypothetical protein